MSKDKVMLIAGDLPLSRRVSRLASERGIDTYLVPQGVIDPARFEPTRTGLVLFDLAFDQQATAIVLVDRLPRMSCAANAPAKATNELLTAALRAVRSPLVTAFGWVTADPSKEGLSQLQTLGKPYGIMRPGPLIEVVLDEGLRTGRKQVLVRTEAVQRAREQGAVPIEEVTEEVVGWIQRDAIRQGGQSSILGGETPVQRSIQALGLEPLELSGWRVGLNGALGMPVLDTSVIPWTLRRNVLFRPRPTRDQTSTPKEKAREEQNHR